MGAYVLVGACPVLYGTLYRISKLNGSGESPVAFFLSPVLVLLCISIVMLSIWDSQMKVNTS